MLSILDQAKKVYRKTIGSLIPSTYDAAQEREKMLSDMAGLHIDTDFAVGEYWNTRFKPKLLARCEQHTSELRACAKDPAKNNAALMGASYKYDAVMEIIDDIDSAPKTLAVLREKIENIETITREAESQTDPVFANLE